MPTSQDGRQNRRAERAAAQRRKQVRTRYALGAIGVVVVVIVIIVVVSLTSSSGGGGERNAAPASVVQKTTSVSVSDLAAAMKDAAQNTSLVANPAQAISTPALTVNGKPHIVYFGAEYCPFCAADRWVTVVALSQFGQWHNLKVTHSSATDAAGPNTPTFSFHGAGYTSPYVAFSGYEIEDRAEKPLDTVPKALASLPETVAAAINDPNFDPRSIPFLDIGGKFVQSGAPYAPTILAHKSWQDVADALHVPASPIYQTVLANAAEMVQNICTLTNNKPANVCGPLTSSASSAASTAPPANGATSTTQPHASKLPGGS